MLLSLGDDATFNSVVNIPRIHNSILPAWSTFGAMRAAFNEMTSQHVDQATGKGEIAMKSGSPAALKFYEVNQIASEIISRADRDYEESDLALKSASKLPREKLGLKLSAVAKLPAGK